MSDTWGRSLKSCGAFSPRKSFPCGGTSRAVSFNNSDKLAGINASTEEALLGFSGQQVRQGYGPAPLADCPLT